VSTAGADKADNEVSAAGAGKADNDGDSVWNRVIRVVKKRVIRSV
jgi:hypothetical protein